MKTRRFVAVTVGVMVLSAGLMLMSVNRGAQAAPPASNPGNLFQAILDKLDQVLAAITGAAGQNNHTLRWDTNNNVSATRFTTAFNGAVLDNNTGLVWEQAPDITGGPNLDGRRSWAQATHHCVNRTVGGTVGWRLPSVVELKSVQDPTLGAPFVPVSVFTGLQSSNYWSATLVAEDPTFVWSVGFLIGSVFSHDSRTNGSLPTWCVRGGMNADTY